VIVALGPGRDLKSDLASRSGRALVTRWTGPPTGLPAPDDPEPSLLIAQ
jgi:hypothetical protein